MRKGLTLIELILSMVIIGIVFTVIPRLIMSMNQSTQTTIKEEAMYDAMAQMGLIINLPWDNNNTQNPQILNVNAGNPAYDCNLTSGYRIGGFVGGRNCIETTAYNAGPIGKEDAESNDIDDYHDTNLTADKNCSSTLKKGLFAIGTTVLYVDDPAATGTAVLSTNPKAANQTSNTKYILVRVGYGSDSQHKGCIASLQYHSFNIGNIQINSRNW
ncbi:MAG: type II secretion system protein [Sulfuricurvum sp.]|uniref:prepilin-type N-terminal cleavage/methylation domain-containing protein n=1 Tax=Sulfuricurvum sp. TaxID=2025608 RepID=UPI00260660B4|nr:type II secretion system protein [Sulfuricurvum sp.]MDD2369258.1 type II secretion system protein [Sulfuricurvum sp.]MDD5116973.1 type II secretion system protein [Sulfuricurvum sp.]